MPKGQNPQDSLLEIKDIVRQLGDFGALVSHPLRRVKSLKGLPKEYDRQVEIAMIQETLTDSQVLKLMGDKCGDLRSQGSTEEENVAFAARQKVFKQRSPNNDDKGSDHVALVLNFLFASVSISPR